MTERPILFSAEMVRAILAGTKRQTRRIMKSQPPGPLRPPMYPVDDGYFWSEFVGMERKGYRCPFGLPGDRLWVRETWAMNCAIHGDARIPKTRPADLSELTYRADGDWSEQHGPIEPGSFVPPWRPSLHMPRWACRLVLVITSIRVERLQSGGDREFWGEARWAKNPWVWVLEFQPLEQEVAHDRAV